MAMSKEKELNNQFEWQQKPELSLQAMCNIINSILNMLARSSNTVYSDCMVLSVNILLYIHSVHFLFWFILNVLFMYRFLSLIVCYCTCTVLQEAFHTISNRHLRLQSFI